MAEILESSSNIQWMGRRRRRVKRHNQVKQKVIVLSHSVPCDCWLLAALPPPGDDDDDDEPTAFICIFLKCCLRDWPCYSWGLNADSPQINSRLRSFLFPLRKYSQIHDARLDLYFFFTGALCKRVFSLLAAGLLTISWSMLLFGYWHFWYAEVQVEDDDDDGHCPSSLSLARPLLWVEWSLMWSFQDLMRCSVHLTCCCIVVCVSLSHRS